MPINFFQRRFHCRCRRRYFSTLVLRHLRTSHVVHKTYRSHCIKQQLILHVDTPGCWMLVHRRLTLGSMSPVTIYTPG